MDMYQIDFDRPVRVHMIGIGGISMSGLAQILLSRGFFVSGSDRARSDLTDALSAQGAVIYEGQRAENIAQDTDVVVYTAAIRPDNPEYARAEEMGIPLLSRAQLLGELMRNYGTAVAVAGTHGKTTTTAMLSEILLEADADPTVSVGGIVPTLGGNVRIGYSDCIVAEACEYTDSFLEFAPTVAVILNISEDHPDYFTGGLPQIRSSFRRFASLVPAGGIVVIDTGIENFREIVEGLPARIVTVGHAGSAGYALPEEGKETVPLRPDYCVTDYHTEAGDLCFTLAGPDGTEETIRLSVPGTHNVEDAAAAAAAAREMGISWEAVKAGLSAFRGTERRFERKGSFHGVMVVDDYAHHPDEIRATLTAARTLPCEKVWCVFQPHTYSRTKALFEEFAKALSLADEVVLADIYAAREEDDGSVSSEMLAERMAGMGCRVHYLPTFEKIEKFLYEHCSPGDLLITMGAGDIVKVGEALVRG